MGVRGLLCFLLVVTSIWAKSDDVDHLNLKSIFRIPRDFSKANFDHFELLERNNFHDQGNTASNVVSKKAKNAHRRTFQPSFANAQVMLRIGGDDMRDCSRVSLQQRQFGHQNGGYHQQQLPMTYNPYMPQTPVYPCHQTPAYSYPGCYYPAPVQNYGQPQYPGYNINNAQTCYGSNFPDTSITYQGPESGSNFLEGITYTDHSEEDEDNAVEPIDPPTECSSSENQSKEENPLMPQIPVPQGNTTTDIECRNENMVHRSDPLTTKVSYVEVNLADAEKSCLKKCDSEKEQSLQNDEACSPEKPAEKYIDEDKLEEQIQVGSSDIICGTCNRDRDPNVPYGQRFSKDVDSLFNIAANNDDQKKAVPTAVESGDGLHYQQFALPQQSYGFQDNSMFQNSNPYFESTSSIQTSYLSNAGSPQQSIMQHVCVGPAASVCEGNPPDQQVSVNQKVIQTLHPYQRSTESFRNEQVLPPNSHYSRPISQQEVVYAKDFQPAHTNTQDWPMSHPYQENSIQTSETEAEGSWSTQNGEEVIPSSYAAEEGCSNVAYEQYKDNSESQSNVVENTQSNCGDNSQSTIPESSPSDESIPPCSSDDQYEKQEVSADNPSDLEIDVIPAKNPSGDLNVQFIPAPHTQGEPDVHVISENNQRDEPNVEDSKPCDAHDEPKVEDIPDRNQWDEDNDEVVPENHFHDSPGKKVVKDKFFRQKYTAESDSDWSSSAGEGVQHNQDDSEESCEENGGYDSDNPKCHQELSNDLVKLNEEEPQVSKEEYSSLGPNAIRSFIYKEPSSFGPFRIGGPSDSLDDHDHIKCVHPQRTIVDTCELPYRQPFLDHKILSHASPVADSHKRPTSIYYLRQQPTGSRYLPQLKPHIYKISPRRESTSDLVPTNHYLKVKIPRRTCRCGYVPVETVDKELSLIRDSPCVCTSCRMFSGELEQLDCDF